MLIKRSAVQLFKDQDHTHYAALMNARSARLECVTSSEGQLSAMAGVTSSEGQLSTMAGVTSSEGHSYLLWLV